MAFEFLRKVPLFAGLSDADLEALCEMTEQIRLKPAQTLFEEGDPGDRAYVVQEGELEILKRSSGREVLLAVRGSGEVVGELALLEEAPRMAGARARGETLLLAIRKAQLEHLISTSATAARAMFYTVIQRLRSTTAMLQQSEKMAQLGTLSAGVAHELNNPAAAVKRSADQLEQSLAGYATAGADLGELPRTHSEALQALAAELTERARRPIALDPLDRSDQEEALEQWLEDQGIDEAWELAPMLVEAGYGPEGVQGLAERFPPEALVCLARWMAATTNLFALVGEIGHGAERISAIVKSLKGYSYLDQAPVQDVDVHEGLDNTLTMLRPKLRALTVKREYADDLPIIHAYGSELNQVWTNLLDNAADALDGQGTVTLRTRRDGAWITVEIEDDGPGIPPDIQKRVFDAFFTTKPPGKGTGLGLDISWNIVVHKHRGEIRLDSKPGRTRFTVRLPIDFTNDAAISTSRAPDDDVLRALLTPPKVIAAVGFSSDPGKPSHSVPAALQGYGFTIVPVNPGLAEGLGATAYPDLLSIPGPVDIVQIFRRPEAVPEIVEQAIAIGAKALWMQEGVVHEAAAEHARDAGLVVVMDLCMRATYRRLFP